MTDKELLEAAAKAAGIDYDIDSVGQLWTPSIPENDGKSYLQNIWNPLTDDGDSLRLAVKLGMDINTYSKSKEVAAGLFDDDGFKHRHNQRFNEDPYAATRRAIVLAAAEIGRMK